jgi:hypothetical protein
MTTSSKAVLKLKEALGINPTYPSAKNLLDHLLAEHPTLVDQLMEYESPERKGGFKF